MIPKMNYVVFRGNVNKEILNECLEGIKEQSNVKDIIILDSFDSYYQQPDIWTVFVESDVYLSNGWAERMWQYHNMGKILIGRAAAHSLIRDYKKKKIKLGITNEFYMQSTMACGLGVLNNKVVKQSFDNICISVPVVELHCPSYIYNPYYQGKLEIVPYKRILITFLGGVKESLTERHSIFFRHAALRCAGMLMRRILGEKI